MWRKEKFSNKTKAQIGSCPLLLPRLTTTVAEYAYNIHGGIGRWGSDIKWGSDTYCIIGKLVTLRSYLHYIHYQCRVKALGAPKHKCNGAATPPRRLPARLFLQVPLSTCLLDFCLNTALYITINKALSQ